MPATPTQRNTRSNSNAQNITLQDIKTLIENSKTEILLAVNCKVDKLSETIGSLVNCVENLKERQEQLEQKCRILEDKCNRETTQKVNCEHENVRDTYEELGKRFDRRKNIVVRGIGERGSGTLEERRKLDTQEVQSILEEIGIEDCLLGEPLRLGKLTQGRPRLLRITCSSVDKKVELLSKSKRLKHSTRFSKVYINPDLTPLEQKESRKLQEELKQRRQAGEDVFIYRGGIMRKDNFQNFQ